MITTKTRLVAAALAYAERLLRNLASWRYFLERVDRLLALESRAEDKRDKEGLILSSKRELHIPKIPY